MARSGGYLVAPTAAAWLLTWLDPATVFTIIGFTSCLAFLPVLMLKPSGDPSNLRQDHGSKLPTLWNQAQTAFFSAVSNKALWLAGPLEMLVYLSTYSIRAFLPLYALYVAGFDLIMVGLFFSIQEGAHLLTRPLGGRLGDRVGYLRTIAVGFLLIAPAVALLSVASNGIHLLLIAIVLGCGQGLIFPSTVALVSDRIPPQHLGTGMGFMGTMRNVGKVLGPLLTGLLLGWLDYDAVFQLSAAAMAIVALAISRPETRFLHWCAQDNPNPSGPKDKIMSQKPSRLSTPINFDAPGKQCDYVRLPHSVHRSAYGWLAIPIVCISNGEGPTVLLMSGTHGDEYEGQVTLTKLVNQLEADDINGRLIILPMANFPAARAGLRTSPIDELNLNRVYPGDPDGLPTLQIAYYIETVLMKMADYGLDLHSGGSSLHYLPSAIGSAGTDDDAVRVRELMKVFGAPYSIFLPGRHAGGGGSNDGAARQNMLSFGTEMGGSGTVTPDCLEHCFNGVVRFLYELGVLKQQMAPPAETPTRMVHAPSYDYFTYSLDVGLFEPVVNLGDEIQKGDLAGRVHFPETPWQTPADVHFTADGLVVCKRIPGRVERGDCLFHLGADYEE